MESGEILNSRISYYTSLAKEVFSKQPDNFVDFVHNPEAVSMGDELLTEEMSTGYNYVHKNKYPMPEEQGTILYSVYSQRHSHFGEVLARMESLKIIDNNFKFYLRGTKIVGDYRDLELVDRPLVLGSGKTVKTLESVEGTLAFRPKDGAQAVEIAAFLVRQARRIKGGYRMADVRASLDLESLIEPIGFEVAVANIITFKNGDIITLKQKSAIDEEGFRSSKIPINRKLYKYLISGEVKP